MSKINETHHVVAHIIEIAKLYRMHEFTREHLAEDADGPEFWILDHHVKLADRLTDLDLRKMRADLEKWLTSQEINYTIKNRGKKRSFVFTLPEGTEYTGAIIGTTASILKLQMRGCPTEEDISNSFSL